MNILVTGATGLIGRSLCQLLTASGHTLTAVSRKPNGIGDLAVTAVHKWDPLAERLPAVAVEGIETVVHLAGEPIAQKRWSAEQKRRIRDSRVVGTRNLVEGLRQASSRPSTLISGSAVGFYGDRGDEQLDEDSTAGSGFLPDVCKEWEKEASVAADLGIRVVLVRTSVVLSPKGGALKRMLPAFKLGVAGPLGSGKQWFPWIHLQDMAALLKHTIDNSSIRGPLNAVAPESVTNTQFTERLARVLHRPAFVPIPRSGLRMLMGEMADVLLDSQRVYPKAALESGYRFQYPKLEPALRDLLG